LSSDDICEDATTLTIHGSGFLPGTNTVAFTPAGTAGTVTYVDSHTLSVTGITGLTAGALYAVVTNTNGSSGSPVQVATVEPTPSITSSSSNVTQATGNFTFHGTGFVPSGTSVSLSSGTYTVVSVSPTSITVNFTVAPSLGSLTATVITACGTDSDVEVANIVGAGSGSTLVGHWPLNETSGLIAHDSTTNANDLTLVGSTPPWDADTPGSQAGSGGCVALGSEYFQRGTDTGLPHGSSDVSVSFWFKLTSSSDVLNFAYGTSDYVVFQRSGSSGITLFDESGTHSIAGATSGISDSAWHLYTMTWKGSDASWKYYEDGTLVNSGTSLPLLNSNAGFIEITSSGSGKMKDVRIYSGVLNATDVSNIFGGSPP
ncbi:MAG TPA: LamG-like jellyroll fold domain-containing protein, partial [Gemmataceae bacterium]|nr:LamG-like jellyroll fold domain-containing protein [Gemmataceae bacterium]